jgi:succinate dehydrogenase / fumarate reductase cytochrome b subunit
MALFDFLKSSILSKIAMAVTGLLLVLFIVGHMVGNLQVFLGRDVFNTYAHFLQSLGELLWVIRFALFATLVVHIISSIRVKLLNAGAKPVKYSIKKYVKATWFGRSMLLTGITVFIFLAYHLAHFTIGAVDPSNFHFDEVYGPNGMFVRHDAWLMVVMGFKQPIVALLYIAGVILLGFHLNHAIQSMFQTLGWNHPKYFPTIEKSSVVFSVIIVLLYMTIPVSILLGLVGGNL